MSSVWPLAVAFVLAYAIGAIPFGYLVARMKGVNLFAVGSGNIGATNVGRVLGAKLGLLVFLLDFAKGAVPVLLLPGVVQELLPDESAGLPRAALQVAAALGAFVGHIFPVYLGFRGGKGVATGCGTVFVLVPGPTVIALLIWLATVCASRTVSLGSLVAALGLIAARLIGTPQALSDDAAIKTWFCIAGALLVFAKHRANLRRLIQGTESRLQEAPGWDRAGKAILVISLGTWFGAALFFNFLAAPAIFDSFKEVVKTAPSDRTAFLPLAANETDERKAQLANALAGAAVGPLFPRFFALQALCGTLAMIIALGWWNAGGMVNRWRVLVLVIALLTIAASWPISMWVSDLRLMRWAPGAAVNDKVQAAFRNAHVISLLLSLVTAILAFVALALCARMPPEAEARRG